jgi:hypothetical protein
MVEIIGRANSAPGRHLGSLNSIHCSRRPRALCSRRSRHCACALDDTSAEEDEEVAGVGRKWEEELEERIEDWAVLFSQEMRRKQKKNWRRVSRTDSLPFGTVRLYFGTAMKERRPTPHTPYASATREKWFRQKHQGRRLLLSEMYSLRPPGSLNVNLTIFIP